MIDSLWRARFRRVAAPARGVLALALVACAVSGCATLGRLPGPFASERAVASPADTAAVRLSPEQRMERIEAALARQESLLRRTNADLSAQLDELLREVRVLSERVSALEERAAATRAPGGEPAYPGGGGLERGERVASLQDEAMLSLGGAPADSGMPGAPAGASAPGEGGAEAGENAGASQAAGESGSAPVNGGSAGAVTSEGQRLYETAYQDLMQSNFQLALIGFRDYLQRYPTTSLSDNAQYWIAEIYYKQQQYTTAIEEFMKVIEDFPGQDKLPAAYYKLGLCFHNVRDDATARRYYELLVAQYPQTPEARLATERLNDR